MKIFRQLSSTLFVKGCAVLLHHVLTRRGANFGDMLRPKSDVIAFSQAKILRSPEPIVSQAEASAPPSFSLTIAGSIGIPRVAGIPPRN